MNARTIATRVLARVERDNAFAAAALDAELERHVQLSARDRALATELVYGVLRLRPWLFSQLEKHATRGLKKSDLDLLHPLLVCAYELLALERVPAFASVNEAVNQVRARRGAPVAAFANALLRKVAAEPKASAEELAVAVASCAPPWLASALTRALGEEGARAFLTSTERTPPIGLRIDDDAARDEILAELRAEHPDATFELGRMSPRAISVRGAGDLKNVLAKNSHALVVQEEGAQVVGLALGVRPGDFVLDACAGRGNKTSLFLRQIGTKPQNLGLDEHGRRPKKIRDESVTGFVDASDVHPKKLTTLREELARVGLEPHETYAVDLSRGTADIDGGYTRILVDAPCSGTGTLRRRPDILLRREEANLAELSKLQSAIVLRAATLLKKGGRLVFAVCSVLREEAEDVVADVLAKDSSLVAAPFDAPEILGLSEKFGKDATAFRLLPQEHGTDGYFVASFRKT